MAAYLVDNPPVRSQYRSPRRADPSGVVVVHTAENTPDFVAFDGGAEAVARFIQGRSDPGSYHDLADSDSTIQLVPYDAEAFHDGTGSNPHSYGVSAATRANVWPLAPAHWVDGCVNQMAAAAARYATWLRTRTGIVIPARRITRSESELRIPGFISHAERDPARRTDPGAQFPWDQFLAHFARLTSPAPQEDDMPTIAELNDAAAAGQLDKLAIRIGQILRDHTKLAQGSQVSGVAALVRGLDDNLDETEVARLVLATLTPQAIAAAIPATIAGDVANELAERLAG